MGRINYVQWSTSLSTRSHNIYICCLVKTKLSQACCTEMDKLLLDKLVPGDIVWCDRRFNIETHVEYYFAEIKILAFTRGEKKLSANDVEESRNISHVRMQGEKVIGNLRRNYKILHEAANFNSMKNITENVTLVDWIVQVSCSLKIFLYHSFHLIPLNNHAFLWLEVEYGSWRHHFKK